MKNIRILISRPDRLGDVVLSTPIPREIKKKYPSGFVVVLVRNYAKDIYLNNPNVDEIIIYPDEEDSFNFLDRLKFIKKIRRYNFTHSLMLLPTERINWLLFFAGVENRIGVGHKFYQFVTNTKSVYRNKYIPLRNEADYCLDSIRKIGIETDNLDTEIFLTESEKVESKKVKNSICSNGELLIGINITSGNSAPNMPIHEYRKLIDKVNEISEVKIAVTDLAIPDEIKNIDYVVYLNEGNDLRKSIIDFAALDLLISASTGPMHIVAALKVKTLSLFCPLTACSPKLWGPKGNDSEIILPEEDYCQHKCPGDPKKCSFSGEEGIDAQKVFERLREMIKR